MCRINQPGGVNKNANAKKVYTSTSIYTVYKQQISDWVYILQKSISLLTSKN